MLRFAAALAAGVVMACAARADTFTCGMVVGCHLTDGRSVGYGETTWIVSAGDVLTVQPYQESSPVSLPVIQRTCPTGWTLVEVWSVDRASVRKCAAVGDLRDPE